MSQNNNFLTELDIEEAIMKHFNLIFRFIHDNTKYLFLYDNNIEDFSQDLVIPYIRCIRKCKTDIAELSTYCFAAFRNNVKMKLRKKYGDKKDNIAPIILNYDDCENFLHSDLDIESKVIDNDILKACYKNKYLKLYLELGSQQKVADKLNCCRSYVSKKIKEATDELKKNINKN